MSSNITNNCLDCIYIKVCGLFVSDNLVLNVMKTVFIRACFEWITQNTSIQTHFQIILFNWRCSSRLFMQTAYYYLLTECLDNWFNLYEMCLRKSYSHQQAFSDPYKSLRSFQMLKCVKPDRGDVLRAIHLNPPLCHLERIRIPIVQQLIWHTTPIRWNRESEAGKKSNHMFTA